MMWNAAMMDMEQYTNIEYSCKPDIDFMSGMIGHHAGAIAMCHVLYALTTAGKVQADPAVAGLSHESPFYANAGSLCYNVTTSQTAEVQSMKAFLSERGYPGEPAKCTTDSGCASSACAGSEGYEAAHMAMMTGMNLNYTCDPTADFVGGMIAHHQGALAMCEVVATEQAKGTHIDAEVSSMCENVVAAQTREIGWMTSWLRAHGYASPPAKCETEDSGVVPMRAAADARKGLHQHQLLT